MPTPAPATWCCALPATTSGSSRPWRRCGGSSVGSSGLAFGPRRVGFPHRNQRVPVGRKDEDQQAYIPGRCVGRCNLVIVVGVVRPKKIRRRRERQRDQDRPHLSL